ncbi:hypothetical protein K2X85_06900 [bacterium]|nr:hypothetical protein [bacterium]
MWMRSASRVSRLARLPGFGPGRRARIRPDDYFFKRSATSRQTLTQARQDLAQAMQASVQVPLSQHLSHSAAHFSQASAHAAAMEAVRGPPRAQICAHAVQIAAQSIHVAAHGIIPLGLKQSATHVWHAILQSAQTFAQSVSLLPIME